MFQTILWNTYCAVPKPLFFFMYNIWMGFLTEKLCWKHQFWRVCPSFYTHTNVPKNRQETHLAQRGHNHPFHSFSCQTLRSTLLRFGRIFCHISLYVLFLVPHHLFPPVLQLMCRLHAQPSACSLHHIAGALIHKTQADTPSHPWASPVIRFACLLMITTEVVRAFYWAVIQDSRSIINIGKSPTAHMTQHLNIRGASKPHKANTRRGNPQRKHMVLPNLMQRYNLALWRTVTYKILFMWTRLKKLNNIINNLLYVCVSALYVLLFTTLLDYSIHNG